MQFIIHEFINKKDFLNVLNIRYGETIYDKKIPKYKYKKKLMNYIFHKNMHLKENMVIKFYIPNGYICDPHEKAYTYTNDGYKVVEFSLPYIDAVILNSGYKQCMKLFEATRKIPNTSIEKIARTCKVKEVDLENQLIVLSLFDISEYVVLDDGGKVINII